MLEAIGIVVVVFNVLLVWDCGERVVLLVRWFMIWYMMVLLLTCCLRGCALLLSGCVY